MFSEQYDLNQMERAFAFFDDQLVPLTLTYADFKHKEPFEKALAVFSKRLQKYRDQVKQRETDEDERRSEERYEEEES